MIRFQGATFLQTLLTAHLAHNLPFLMGYELETRGDRVTLIILKFAEPDLASALAVLSHRDLFGGEMKFRGTDVVLEAA